MTRLPGILPSAIVLLPALAGADETPVSVGNPWGISSSAGSLRNHADWLPGMAAAGVTSVRLFPEWGEIEPAPGRWNWERADALVVAASGQKTAINGRMMGSPPGSKASHAFPKTDLAGWSRFVAAAVGRFRDVGYWEVWNEGNGG